MKTLIRTSDVSRRLVVSLLAVTQLVSSDACGSGGANQAKEAGETRIAQLAGKHGANRDWTGSIRKADGLDGVFAFEMQDAFDPLIGRPILAIVTVADIYRTTDGYRLVCYLSPKDAASVGWEHLYFLLDLSPERARKLAGLADSRFSEVFAVVMVPTRADVRFSREVEALKPESTEDEASLDVGRPSGSLWVRGTSLDIEHLPGY